MNYSARHWEPAVNLAAFAGDINALEVLHRHGIHADHCNGYEVLAWPCPMASMVLKRLICPCGDQRPCPIHDWHDNCCSCGWASVAHCQSEHLPADVECAACGRTAP